VRGDIVRIKANRTIGHEQRGERLGVVVQDDQYTWTSTLAVCPTSTSAGPAVYRPEIEIIGRPTRVLVEQVGALDLGRIIETVGHLRHDEMAAVDRALKRFLGL
jgi:mRNA interferase MazF